MRPAALLLALLLVPTAVARVPFEIAFDDPAGDVVTSSGRRMDYPGADVLSFSSTEIGGRVEQRVTMRATPHGPQDSVLVRSWYANSTGTSFFVIDMEVRGDAATIDDQFRPVKRHGSFYDVTVLEDARWHVENATWVFSFDVAHVEGSDCFDPGVFAERIPTRIEQLPKGTDMAVDERRRCRTAEEPVTPPSRTTPPTGEPPPRDFPTAPTGPGAPAPPGSRAPTPGVGALALVGMAFAAMAFRRRRD